MVEFILRSAVLINSVAGIEKIDYGLVQKVAAVSGVHNPMEIVYFPH